MARRPGPAGTQRWPQVVAFAPDGYPRSHQGPQRPVSGRD